VRSSYAVPPPPPLSGWRVGIGPLLAVLPVLLLVACSSGRASRPSVVASPLPVCATYADNIDAYAFCVQRQAARWTDAAPARAMCEALPPEDAGACRAAWVEERLHSATPTPYDTLMGMCQGLDDCSFNVIDSFPSPDGTEQVKRCREHTGRFAEDCVGHALQRWAQRVPDEDAIQAMAVYAGDYPWAVGTWIGVLRWCGGERVPMDPSLGDAWKARCPAEPKAAKACVDAIVTAQRTGGRCGMPAAVAPPPVPEPDRSPVPGRPGPPAPHR